MEPDAAQPIRIFYSYAHEDEGLRRELANNLALLRNDGRIEDWSDRDIRPGDEWDADIDERLDSADLILLLVSSDFISSKYIMSKELEVAIARHQSGQARVVPIVVRPVYFAGAPFAKLQMLPSDAKSIIEWEPRSVRRNRSETGRTTGAS